MPKIEKCMASVPFFKCSRKYNGLRFTTQICLPSFLLILEKLLAVILLFLSFCKYVNCIFLYDICMHLVVHSLLRYHSIEEDNEEKHPFLSAKCLLQRQHPATKWLTIQRVKRHYKILSFGNFSIFQNNGKTVNAFSFS